MRLKHSCNIVSLSPIIATSVCLLVNTAFYAWEASHMLANAKALSLIYMTRGPLKQIYDQVAQHVHKDLS
jgi:hypothetical protein